MTNRRSSAALWIAATALVLGACDTAPRAAATAESLTLHEVPGSEADVAGDIPALDALVDAQGSRHLAWVASAPGRATQVFYARWDAGAQMWTAPQRIADTLTGQDGVRILQTSEGLHVIFDKKLRRLVSRDNGITWHEQEPFVTQKQIYTDFFDAVTVADQIVAVYLTQPRVAYEARERKGNSDQELYSVRSPVEGRPASALVTRFPGSMFPPLMPKLVFDSRRLHLLCAIQAERHSGPSIEGKLYYLRSDDAGASWSEPVDMLAAGIGASASGHGDLQSIQGIEMIADRRVGGIKVFYNETNVYATESVDGREWSPPVQINRGARMGPGASYRSKSIGAAIADSGGRIVWIDTRHRKSDRRWLNPLGGFPWSDDPDWSNNDIMMLPLKAVGAGPPATRSIATAERLTPDKSFASVVRVRASADSLLVVWSGRRKVGKRLDTYGEKPRLFYATVPM
jgi:hypothetical protein